MRPVMPAIGRVRFGTYLLVPLGHIVACVTQALLDTTLYLDYIARGRGERNLCTDLRARAFVGCSGLR